MVSFFVVGFDGDGEVIWIEIEKHFFFFFVVDGMAFNFLLEFFKAVFDEFRLVLVDVFVEGVFEGEVNSRKLVERVEKLDQAIFIGFDVLGVWAVSLNSKGS